VPPLFQRFRIEIAFLLLLNATPIFSRTLTVNYDLSRYWVNGHWTGEWHQVPGHPALPVLLSKVLLPYGTKVISVTPHFSHVVSSHRTLPSTVVPPATPFCDCDAWNNHTAADSWLTVKFPVGDTLYQEKEGYRIAFTPLYPAETLIDGTSKTVNAIELDFELAAETPSVFYRGSIYDKWDLSPLVENPSVLSSYPALPSPGRKDYLTIGPRALVTATGPETLDSLEVEKTARGIFSERLALEDIAKNYSGRDLAEKIRNAISDHYLHHGTRYVLLLGDAEKTLPTRLIRVEANIRGDIPSDAYYANLNGDFDHNGNGVFGEIDDGENSAEIDLLSEVVVGRAPISTVGGLHTFVKKTLAATKLLPSAPNVSNSLLLGEKADASTLASWLLEKLVAGAIPSTANSGITSQGFSSGTRFTKIYETFDWSTSARQVIDTLNAGNFYTVNHAGHATTRFDLKFPDYLIPMLQNSSPFFLYSQGCNAGDFTQTNWASELINAPGGGAFAAVVNSSLGFFNSGESDGPSNIFHRKFFNQVFQAGVRQLGRANQLSKESLINEIEGDPTMRWIYFETNLLGDPELNFKF
jgi:hypothetical protein